MASRGPRRWWSPAMERLIRERYDAHEDEVITVIHSGRIRWLRVVDRLARWQRYLLCAGIHAPPLLRCANPNSVRIMACSIARSLFSPPNFNVAPSRLPECLPPSILATTGHRRSHSSPGKLRLHPSRLEHPSPSSPTPHARPPYPQHRHLVNLTMQSWVIITGQYPLIYTPVDHTGKFLSRCRCSSAH